MTASLRMVSSAAAGSNRVRRVSVAAHGDGRVEGAGLAEGVEQGQAAEEHVAGADVEQGLHGSGGVAEEVAVRQFGALRRAGGA